MKIGQQTKLLQKISGLLFLAHPVCKTNTAAIDQKAETQWVPLFYPLSFTTDSVFQCGE